MAQRSRARVRPAAAECATAACGTGSSSFIGNARYELRAEQSPWSYEAPSAGRSTAGRQSSGSRFAPEEGAAATEATPAADDVNLPDDRPGPRQQVLPQPNSEIHRPASLSDQSDSTTVTDDEHGVPVSRRSTLAGAATLRPANATHRRNLARPTGHKPLGRAPGAWRKGGGMRWAVACERADKLGANPAAHLKACARRHEGTEFAADAAQTRRVASRLRQSR